MAISENDVAAFIKHRDIRIVGNRLISVPKKKEKGFFHVEIDIPEEEIDELLSDESGDMNVIPSNIFLKFKN